LVLLSFRAVNAGKSSKNEDQAAFHCGHLHRDNGRLVRQIDEWAGTRPDELQENMFVQSLPYYYVAVFDGHAGSGAAVVASRQLHHILHVSISNQYYFTRWIRMRGSQMRMCHMKFKG
jgi:hypothetical protein